MIDIDLRAADFEAELDKVRQLNKEKREKRLQERDAGKNDCRLKAFLQELTALSDKYEIYIEGCGCCGSPWLNDIKAGKNYDNLAYRQEGYEVEN